MKVGFQAEESLRIQVTLDLNQSEVKQLKAMVQFYNCDSIEDFLRWKMTGIIEDIEGKQLVKE